MTVSFHVDGTVVACKPLAEGACMSINIRKDLGEGDSAIPYQIGLLYLHSDTYDGFRRFANAILNALPNEPIQTIDASTAPQMTEFESSRIMPFPTDDLAITIAPLEPMPKCEACGGETDRMLCVHRVFYKCRLCQHRNGSSSSAEGEPRATFAKTPVTGDNPSAVEITDQGVAGELQALAAESLEATQQ